MDKIDAPKYKFLEEVHDYIDERYNKFLKYQKYAQDMLKEFHDICINNNITYFSSYGTLLGFVRDQNSIPWDYDVDVQVPYEEKDKLINVLQKELDSQYYIYCPEVNSNCRHFFLRISKVGYNSSALHVDVFYIIGTPNDTTQYNKFAKRIKFLASARYKKLVDAKEESFGRKTTYLKIMFYKIMYGPIPLKLINFNYDRLCNKYSFKNAKYYMSADIFGYKRYSKKFIEKTEAVKIDGSEYIIPSGYEEILKIAYGDYKSYPTIASRYNEFMSSLNRLEYFDEI